MHRLRDISLPLDPNPQKGPLKGTHFGTVLFLILVLFWDVQEDETRSPCFGGCFRVLYFSPTYFLEGETYQMTSSTFFALTSPPFQRLVVAGGFGDSSALASTEVITVPLEFY